VQGKEAQADEGPAAQSLQTEVRPRGRPAAASPDDVLDAGLHRYLRGQRVDVQAIAAELGLGRATIYRWFGSREKLLGEVIIRATEPVLAKARSGLSGKGAPGLLDTFDRFNRALADAPALRAFVEQERDASLRIIASGAGIVQPRIVELITALIAEEVEAGTYKPRVEPSVLGFAIVKLAQAFLFNDAAVGIRGDVDRLREVEASLLGVPA
jgi:AcrR family transcriptional regulator